MAGQRSNQLNYVPTRQINEMRNNQSLCGVEIHQYLNTVDDNIELPCSCRIAVVLRKIQTHLVSRSRRELRNCVREIAWTGGAAVVFRLPHRLRCRIGYRTRVNCVRDRSCRLPTGIELVGDKGRRCAAA